MISLQCLGECCESCRPLRCTAHYRGQSVTFPDEFCTQPRPDPPCEKCERQDCPRWSESEWGACQAEGEAECGVPGLQTKEVQCVNSTGGVLDRGQCCGQPIESQACAMPTCAPDTCEDRLYICADATSVHCKNYSSFYEEYCCATCRNLTS